MEGNYCNYQFLFFFFLLFFFFPNNNQHNSKNTTTFNMELQRIESSIKNLYLEGEKKKGVLSPLFISLAKSLDSHFIKNRKRRMCFAWNFETDQTANEEFLKLLRSTTGFDACFITKWWKSSLSSPQLSFRCYHLCIGLQSSDLITYSPPETALVHLAVKCCSCSAPLNLNTAKPCTTCTKTVHAYCSDCYRDLRCLYCPTLIFPCATKLPGFAFFECVLCGSTICDHHKSEKPKLVPLVQPGHDTAYYRKDGCGKNEYMFLE